MMQVSYSLSQRMAGICNIPCCLVQSSVHVSRFSIQAMGRLFAALESMQCAVPLERLLSVNVCKRRMVYEYVHA